MIVGTISVDLYAPWVHSLKEKRMIVKSITAKIRNRYNVSVAEIDKQDVHKTIVIGVAAVTTETKHANSILNEVLNFIESNTEAEIINSQMEIL